MKKLSGIFLAGIVALFLAGSVYAETPTDPSVEQVGDDSTLFGVSVGRNLPLICDGFSYVWDLSVSSPGHVTGTCDTGSCGIWNASGTFDSVNVSLTATNPNNNGCCTAFTYVGHHTGKAGKTASGTWTNTCGGSGSWSAGLCK